MTYFHMTLTLCLVTIWTVALFNSPVEGDAVTVKSGCGERAENTTWANPAKECGRCRCIYSDTTEHLMTICEVCLGREVSLGGCTLSEGTGSFPGCCYSKKTCVAGRHLG